jgi:hypothetical protein
VTGQSFSDILLKLALNTNQSFSPGTPVFSTIKNDRHDITEILLKVALSTINLNLNLAWFSNKKNPEKPIISFDGS